MDTPIPQSNVGYKLLQKMGWKENTPLGKQTYCAQGEDSINTIEPIRICIKDDTLGLGQKEVIEFWTDPSLIKRKPLASELELSNPLLIQREHDSVKQQKIKEEVQTILRPFYCSLCDKQYKRATEYDTHLSSYDHNHTKVRFTDLHSYFIIIIIIIIINIITIVCSSSFFVLFIYLQLLFSTHNALVIICTY
jgi:hypothetical protein